MPIIQNIPILSRTRHVKRTAYTQPTTYCVYLVYFGDAVLCNRNNCRKNGPQFIIPFEYCRLF